MNHSLKTYPIFFNAVQSGAKQFELRKNDRDFVIGDTVTLEEWVAESAPGTRNGYTGRKITKQVSYVLKDFPGLEWGYCILGFKEIEHDCVK